MSSHQASKNQTLRVGWGWVGVVSIIQQQREHMIRIRELHMALKWKEFKLLYDNIKMNIISFFSRTYLGTSYP